jgi:hypothetical protein
LQRLRGHRVLDFGGADPKRQRTESTMGAGVRVTTDNGHPWQRCTLLRSNHMDDTLTQIVHLEFDDIVLCAVRIQRIDLQL